MNTIKKFAKELDWSLNSTVMLLHERHVSRYSTLELYSNMYYKPAADFEKYTYQTGVMQGLGIKIAVESHRRNKPYSMGSLVWQLNDVWPVTSWASVDSYGTWKAQHYVTKRLY